MVWKSYPSVECSPHKVSGTWVFKDTRVPVHALFENLKDRKIRLLVLQTTSWPKIQRKTHEIKTIQEEMTGGTYVDLVCWSICDKWLTRKYVKILLSNVR